MSPESFDAKIRQALDLKGKDASRVSPEVYAMAYRRLGENRSEDYVRIAMNTLMRSREQNLVRALDEAHDEAERVFRGDKTTQCPANKCESCGGQSYRRVRVLKHTTKFGPLVPPVFCDMMIACTSCNGGPVWIPTDFQSGTAIDLSTGIRVYEDAEVGTIMPTSLVSSDELAAVEIPESLMTAIETALGSLDQAQHMEA